MKKKYILKILFLTIIALNATAQQGINYKAIINDVNGDALLTQHVTIQFTILENGTTEVYKESHNAITDVNGIVIVNIGEGEVISGVFDEINWGDNPLFLKTEIDKGDGLIDIGTTQFKAVPYALYAYNIADKDDADADPINELQQLSIANNQLTISEGNTVNLPATGGGKVPVYTSAEIVELVPETGDAVFNTTEKYYLVFDGTSWQVLQSDCWPQPTNADAGEAQTYTDGTTTIVLSANTPESGYGTGLWSITSGEGGNFADASSPVTTFTGDCGLYILKWTISTNCNSSSDQVYIRFFHKPTTADAGEGQTYTDGTATTVLSANTPEPGYGNGKWSIYSGEGGSFVDPTSPTTSFSGSINEIYRLHWTISTNCEISTDEVIIVFWGNGVDVADIDGNVYQTISIGQQVWMAENLKTTKFNDGVDIPLITDNTEWKNLETPGYCWYNNDLVTYGELYGALYNFYTVNTGDLCPTGWHVPTVADWRTLSEHLGGENVAGGKLKETGTTHWYNPNTGATNESGFTALPGGLRLNDYFTNIGGAGYWWSATKRDDNTAKNWILYYSSSIFPEAYFDKSTGISIRCVKD